MRRVSGFGVRVQGDDRGAVVLLELTPARAQPERAECEECVDVRLQRSRRCSRAFAPRRLVARRSPALRRTRRSRGVAARGRVRRARLGRRGARHDPALRRRVQRERHQLEEGRRCGAALVGRLQRERER